MPIQGITIQILEKTQTGTDAFGRPVFTETEEDVENVLIAPMSDEEILDTLNLTGRRAVYQLGIPKGDAHDWENKKVVFFGSTWRVIGKPTLGIEAMIPLQWNKKVKVESIVGESESKTG